MVNVKKKIIQPKLTEKSFHCQLSRKKKKSSYEADQFFGVIKIIDLNSTISLNENHYFVYYFT